MYSFIETIFYLKIKDINIKYDYFYSFALICIILIKSYLIIDSNFFEMIKISVQDAKNIRYIYDSKKTNKALITAVQASDKGRVFIMLMRKGLICNIFQKFYHLMNLILILDMMMKKFFLKILIFFNE